MRTVILAILLMSVPSGGAEPDAHSETYDPTLNQVSIASEGTLWLTESIILDIPGASLKITVTDTLYLAPGVELRAGDGQPGLDARSTGTAIGDPGQDGGDLWIEAARIVAWGATLASGHGGPGGDATAIGDPDALAIGGDGGRAGTIKIIGPVIGALDSVPGEGGAGGEAQAEGKDGAAACTGDHGTEDVDEAEDSLLGDGASASADGSEGSCGPTNGTGGTGGRAEAYGGNGGVSLDGNGGNGGNATAIGGTGGHGLDACFDEYEDADEAYRGGLLYAGNGGNGGPAAAYGGDGGAGQFGGAGGHAIAQSTGGDGGNATFPVRMGMGGTVIIDGFYASGGDGGVGADTGGTGGSASSLTRGGNGGNHCGGLMERGLVIPNPPLIITLLGILVASWNRKRSVKETAA